MNNYKKNYSVLLSLDIISGTARGKLLNNGDEVKGRIENA
jgi:hypothetical protein